jgi:chemosensory pili system protein ChpE
MEGLFFAAFGLSVIFAAQPGVIGFEAVRRGIARGWPAALRLELGSLVGDETWALVALTGASLLFQSPWLTLLLSLFGCYLLLRFAWDALMAARTPETEAATPSRKVPTHDFAAGAMLSLSNPQNLTFWLGISGVIIGMGFLDPQPAHVAVFFAGFMSAQVLWCFFIAALVGLGRAVMNPTMTRWLNLIAAICLAYFGITLVIQTVGMISSLL